MTETGEKTAAQSEAPTRASLGLKHILSGGILCFGMILTILWAVTIAWAIPRLFL
jgi:hypothetical protein